MAEKKAKPAAVEYDTVATASGEYQTTLNKMYSLRKPWQPVNPKHIVSFMPGTVVEIKVKRGQSVKEGESLMIFKAMKMDNNILSPMSGKIRSVNVAEGDNLAKNVVMIELG